MSGGIISTIFALLFAVVLVAGFWSLIMYFAEMGSEEGKKEYKGILIGSITALFLLMCVYAVLQWLGSLIGI
jgi:hypothetical protein